MSRALTRTAGPTTEPVTLAEAKAHLRITDDAEDGYISGLIKTAREAVEAFTGRALLTQSWMLRVDAWPREALKPWVEIPRPPLIAVTAVTVYDAAGAGTVWDPAFYGVDSAGRLYRKPGAVWPMPGRAQDGIAIAFEAGYGANASDVPAALRQGLLLQLAHLFEAREPATMDAGTLALIAPYRVLKL